ncbi:hypothetical protein FRC07_005148, partial [Ceratobasidium sp. 392]
MDDDSHPTHHIEGMPPHGSQVSLVSDIEDDSMFSETETSYNSVSTLESHEIAEYFRSVHGFTYQSDENLPLAFPTDMAYDRLDVILHMIARLCQNGMIVPEEADQLLRNGGLDGRGEARVLDLVTNSAAWHDSIRVNDMSDVYPTANFVSLDTKPLVPHKPHARIKFEVYEFYSGIIEPDESIDMVHVKQSVL